MDLASLMRLAELADVIVPMTVRAVSDLGIADLLVDGPRPVAELAAAGAVRISLGSAIAQAAYAIAVRATAELLTSGTYDAVADGIAYDTMNTAVIGRLA